MPSKTAAKKSDKEEVVPLMKQEKVTKTKASKTDVPAEVPTDVSTVKTKSTKTKASKDVKPEVTEPEVTEPVDTANVVVEDITLAGDFSSLISKFQDLHTRFNELKTMLKTVEKKASKELRLVQKLQSKKKRKGARAPSGFVKPSPISDELASFLGKEKGAEMARTDVTREINKYIHEHKLQDKENGRKIIPDQNLSKLLDIDDSVNLTYFNLQKYMSRHFPKQLKEVAVTAA